MSTTKEHIAKIVKDEKDDISFSSQFGNKFENPDLYLDAIKSSKIIRSISFSYHKFDVTTARDLKYFLAKLPTSINTLSFFNCDISPILVSTYSLGSFLEEVIKSISPGITKLAINGLTITPDGRGTLGLPHWQRIFKAMPKTIKELDFDNSGFSSFNIKDLITLMKSIRKRSAIF